MRGYYKNIIAKQILMVQIKAHARYPIGPKDFMNINWYWKELPVIQMDYGPKNYNEKGCLNNKIKINI